MSEERMLEAIRALSRGWALTPLNGKMPILDEWNKRPRATPDDVETWATKGNLGVRTGEISGVVVVDEDTVKGGCLELQGDIPRTATALTGGGGKHYYFRCPGNGVIFRNTASRIAAGIDTRGEGGQVVMVGSVHPVTGKAYSWAPGLSPEEVGIAELPDWILQACSAPKARPAVPPALPEAPPEAPAAPPQDEEAVKDEAWARAALDAEEKAVREAPEGARNHALNRAAFSLGQIVASGVLPQDTVKHRLTVAAMLAGLGDREIEATIQSGLAAAQTAPRTRPRRRTGADPHRGLRAVTEADLAQEQAPQEMPDILIPGGHVDAQGEYFEIGNDDFVEAVLDALPEGLLYRRLGVAGQLVGGKSGELQFLETTSNRLRVLIDQHVRLFKWVKRKTDVVSVPMYCNCSSDLSGLVLDAAGTSEKIRELKHLTSYPVFLGPDYELAQPGWNEAYGVYYDAPEEIAALETNMSLESIRAVLDDLVTDFPFKDQASRENFYGLLLTPLLRPALPGNAPLHLVQSSLERTGKTKLAGDVFGTIVLGRSAPALQMAGSDEEKDKRILGLLRRGDTIVHIDNVREFLDSAAIASLLTTTEYSGRVLGRTEISVVPNNLTIVATGNNVRATGEIVKRTVPIVLQPATDEPETRNDFKHPDLHAYLSENRIRILSALVSMVEAWKKSPRELAQPPMGGFERWSGVVGGICYYCGFDEWRANARAWARAADPTGEDLRSFVAAWEEKHGEERVTASDLLKIAEELCVFPHVLKGNSERGRMIALARSVLAKHIDTPIAGKCLRVIDFGSQKLYYLEPFI